MITTSGTSTHRRRRTCGAYTFNSTSGGPQCGTVLPECSGACPRPSRNSTATTTRAAARTTRRVCCRNAASPNGQQPSVRRGNPITRRFPWCGAPAHKSSALRQHRAFRRETQA
eukprot:2842011-Prymnesium_polylepis.1